MVGRPIFRSYGAAANALVSRQAAPHCLCGPLLFNYKVLPISIPAVRGVRRSSEHSRARLRARLSSSPVRAAGDRWTDQADGSRHFLDWLVIILCMRLWAHLVLLSHYFITIILCRQCIDVFRHGNNIRASFHFPFWRFEPNSLSPF